MKYNYWLLLFFCSSLYPMWWERTPSRQTTGSVISPRSGFFRMPASLSRSPILSRIVARASKTGVMSAAMGALAAVRSYALRQQAISLQGRPEEMDRYNELRNEISDALKRKQSEHFIQRGYPSLAPTTFSGHFEKYYPVERINQLVKTKKLEEQLEKDYFPKIKSEKTELEELEKQQKLLTEQQPSWWQRITGFVQPEQKKLAARLTENQGRIKNLQQTIQQQETQQQKIRSLIEAID